jgi:hypothetical protein
MPERAMMLRAALCLLAALLALPGHAFELVSPEEAMRPPASGGLVTRGVRHGPKIKLLSPNADEGPVQGAFALRIAFEARGGANIDVDSARIVYLKSRPVDLIERVKPGLSATGIELPDVELPPGRHAIQVSVVDSAGRETMVVFNLIAAQRTERQDDRR